MNAGPPDGPDSTRHTLTQCRTARGNLRQSASSPRGSCERNGVI